jgi:aryl-alcohol dehydrogenase-like predicted oxidoreductase
VAVPLYALLWVVRPQPAQPHRTSFLAVTLAMTLLAYRPLARGRAASEAAGVRRLRPPGGPPHRAGRGPRVVAVLLVLEATRRTVGWVPPTICLAFVAYAFPHRPPLTRSISRAPGRGR